MALAWVALMMGSRRYSRIAIWAFSLWGFADLLFAYYQGAIGVGIETASLEAAWFIPTLAVPLLLWTHVMVFAILLRTRSVEARQQALPAGTPGMGLRG